MEATLHALAGILLRAVPTFLLVVALHLYLKLVFFKPLEKVLHKRHEATKGARDLAGQSLARAAEKTAQYEAAIAAAKAEIYRSQERLHKELQDRETGHLLAARQRAEALVHSAKDGLAADVTAARTTLAGESDALADGIVESILRGSAA